MRKRTLYITDLDGTLLRNDQTVSLFTANTIRNLTEKGMLFSYATARSYLTASQLTKGLPEKLPVIVFNGSFILETGTGKKLLSYLFHEMEVQEILNFLIKNRIYPIVNAFINEIEKFSYIQGKETTGMENFIRSHQNDIRKNPVLHADALYCGEIFHITCIGEAENLRPAYEHFREIYPSVLYRDMYSGDLWLEIHPRGATKANAVLTLKEMLFCDNVVCFGDGKNDIPMFRVSDACYAVSNAEEELKAIATGIIDSNEEDGVAKWLLKHVKF
ncbi:MAG: HAD family hydrolase [Clostridia bacterium]|nr:HAD family hydrolase [Clostridia bacterium]